MTTRASSSTAAFASSCRWRWIKSVEMAGCHIVDDDFMLVTRWLQGEVPTGRRPAAA